MNKSAKFISRSKKIASYPRGAGPAGRRFAMGMQLEALGTILAPWPRRHSPLLEVNCGNGAFLHFLWQCGFDVQASEADPELRLKACKQPVPELEIHAAQDTDLPFENDAFDWVIIHLKSEDASTIRECAGEAARLAKRGFLITFWNSASLPACIWKMSHKKTWSENAIPWWRLWRLLHSMKLGHISCVSTLMAPMELWQRQWRLGGSSVLPFGAWCAIRLDLGPATPGTPMPLRLGAVLSRPEPALEHFNNEIASSNPSGKRV